MDRLYNEDFILILVLYQSFKVRFIFALYQVYLVHFILYCTLTMAEKLLT